MLTQPILLDEPASDRAPGAQDDVTRVAYRERLRQYLQDPASRQAEGFPLGTDEAILALSDPPYYTACPNPFLAEILERWQEERRKVRSARFGGEEEGAEAPTTNQETVRSARFSAQEEGAGAPASNEGGYHREPFAADVSEGKNDPIYNAHSYHTKVPHKAIMRYILHYTEPGDIVLDGFCGTGMTGVAAQLCGDRRAVQELGYQVDDDGAVYDEAQGKRAEALSTNQETVRSARLSAPFSRLGARKAVLVDLSPAATFIAYNYNTPVDVAAFRREAQRILDEVEAECGWMYETNHVIRGVHLGGVRGAEAPTTNDGHGVVRSEGFSPLLKGRINYTVWSDVFVCPQCGQEIVYLDEALDAESQRVREEFPCPGCGAISGKASLQRSHVTYLDATLGRMVETIKRRPVLIEYTVGQHKHTKRVDTQDLELLERIEGLPFPMGIPTVAMPIASMYHGSRLAPKGVTHIHQLFLPRARQALSALWTRTDRLPDPRLRSFMLFAVEQTIWTMSVLNRYRPTGYSQVNQYLAGVYYVPSQMSEVSPWYILNGKVERLARAFAGLRAPTGQAVIATQSAGAPLPLENCVDYIFTDPPFGENIYYADLNYLVESWHGVRTESAPEAIIDQAKHKDLRDYGALMRRCFAAYYRALKPGHWMTVEFHNSHNAVWNAIQEALVAAGFVVADVRTLDKQQGSYRQVTAASAAKQDLIISAYKPNGGLEERFRLEAGTPEGAWDFLRQHLTQLPIVVRKGERLETVGERQRHLLYDRMVAYHIQRGASVPLGAAEFYQGLAQRFVEREGMFFLPEQAPQYDLARLQATEVERLAVFVSDEKSVLQWLRQQLDPALGGKPRTYQELQPEFLQQLHQSRHEALPELRTILEEGFLQDDGDRWYVPDPNRASDLEKVRRRALLRDFAAYREGRGRLKQFRAEAVRAGFEDAWREHDYAAILRVAERLPEEVLQEDQTLLMYYDNATLRTGA